jgi:hypothetical protein
VLHRVRFVALLVALGLALSTIAVEASDSQYTTTVLGLHPTHYVKFNDASPSGGYTDRGSAASGPLCEVSYPHFAGPFDPTSSHVDGDAGYISAPSTSGTSGDIERCTLGSDSVRQVNVVSFWLLPDITYNSNTYDMVYGTEIGGVQDIWRHTNSNEWEFDHLDGGGWCFAHWASSLSIDWHQMAGRITASSCELWVDGVRVAFANRLAPFTDNFTHVTVFHVSSWGEHLTELVSLGLDAGAPQSTATMAALASGALPLPDLLNNGGSPINQRPTGITPITPQTCVVPTDWTQIQQYISWLACTIQNVMASVLNPVITVLNWFLNTAAWLFDFTKPIDFSPMQGLGATLKTRFPFSIPFDIGGILITIFGTSAVAPSFNLDLHVLGADHYIAFNLSWMSPLQTFVRWSELAIFVVAVGLKYREWTGGGW